MSRNPVGLAFTSLLLAVARLAVSRYFRTPKRARIIIVQLGAVVVDSVRPRAGSLYGADTINGYKYADVPSGEHYILNSTKTLQDALPDGSKDPMGPYGNWRGAEETC
ncbi:hypothetical protein NHJ13051_007238 [Beauveria bassiana]